MIIDGIQAYNISIDDLQVIRPIRNMFKRSFHIIDVYKNTYELLRWKSSRLPEQTNFFNNLESLCKQSIDNRYRILQLDNSILPIIFKHKGKVLKTLAEYNPNHIRSSIIKSVLLDGTGEINTRIDKSIYILYIYWFLIKGSYFSNLSGSKNNNLKEITHNVCIDIETIISTFIDKGFTTYKNYTITGELVDALREKLIHEKLLNASDI
jgi:hypothetical protein